MVTPSLTISIVLPVGPGLVFLLLKSQPHLLLLSGKLFHTCCKYLDLQGQCYRILVGLHLNLGIEWRPKYENVIPTDSAKLMMRKSSAIEVRLDEVGTSCCTYGCGEEPSSSGHRCGACHRVSDDKVSV